MKMSEGVTHVTFLWDIVDYGEGGTVKITPTTNGEECDPDLMYWVMAAETFINSVVKRCNLDRDQVIKNLAKGAKADYKDMAGIKEKVI